MERLDFRAGLIAHMIEAVVSKKPRGPLEFFGIEPEPEPKMTNAEREQMILRNVKLHNLRIEKYERLRQKAENG